MSVILKEHSSSKILLYSKGADNILIDRMSKPISKKSETVDALTDFSNQGLRTLAVASKEIGE
jgi:magnesium-transporting ATPase (P-type)